MNISTGMINTGAQTLKGKQTIARFQKFGAKNEEELMTKLNSLKGVHFDSFISSLGFRNNPDLRLAKETVLREFRKAKMDYEQTVSPMQ